MSTAVQRRGGTTAEHSAFAGLNREITIDTTKGTVVVHNGTTAGGFPLLREDGSNSAFALGSASVPSVKFVGDTNTGIYSPGADQLAIATGGTGRLFVDASGRVGIGTLPQSTLDVKGDGRFFNPASNTSLSVGRLGDSVYNNGIYIYSAYNSNTLTYGVVPTFEGIYNYYTAGYVFRQHSSGTSFTETARFDNYGRFLIGTSTANASGAKLQTSDGITFPATQVASADPNTLDDYEEGTWTPSQGAGLTVVGNYSSLGWYTKTGNIVTVFASLYGSTSIASSASSVICGGLPFVPVITGWCVGSMTDNAGAVSNTCVSQSANVYGAVAMAANSGIYFTMTYRV